MPNIIPHVTFLVSINLKLQDKNKYLFNLNIVLNSYIKMYDINMILLIVSVIHL